MQNPGWFAGLGGPAVRAITYPRSSAFTPLVPLDYPTPDVSRADRARLFRGGRPSRARLRRAYHTTQNQRTQSGTDIPNPTQTAAGSPQYRQMAPTQTPCLEISQPNPGIGPTRAGTPHETKQTHIQLPTRRRPASRAMATTRPRVRGRSGGRRFSGRAAQEGSGRSKVEPRDGDDQQPKLQRRSSRTEVVECNPCGAWGRDTAQTPATKERPRQEPEPLKTSVANQDAAIARPIRSACSVAPPKTNSKRLAVVKYRCASPSRSMPTPPWIWTVVCARR